MNIKEITFCDYFKITRPTTSYRVKIVGVIFTVITVIIVALNPENYSSNSILEPIKMFVICFLLGNGFGLFIFSLAITEGYKQVKSTIRFYNSIPENIKMKYGIHLQPITRDKRYDYLNLQIMNRISNNLVVRFEKSKNEVFIFLYAVFNENINFQKKVLELNKKHKKLYISLTGWGLKKTIHEKEWDNINDEKLEYCIEELCKIAHDEKMNVGVWEPFENNYNSDKYME